MAYFYKLQIQPQATYIEIPLRNRDEQCDSLPRAFLSLKSAGNMAFSNRQRFPFRDNFFTQLGINKAKVYSLYQDHTQDIVKVDKNNKPGAYHKMLGDGLITSERDIFLTITVADCLPIFIFDKKKGFYGIIHSGWKGTGIILNAVSFMESCFDIQKKNLKIVIGPGIGPCCYNVPIERYTHFATHYGDTSCREEEENYYLNLAQANINLLNNNGISDIDVITNCTSCTPALQSFRRDGKERYGLMMALMGNFK